MNNLILPKGYNDDVKQRMFADCLDSLDPAFKPSDAPMDKALELGRLARSRVITTIRPMLTNPLLKWDDEAKKNLAQCIANEYGSEFVRMSHEDLAWLVTVIHTDGLMKKIIEQCG